MRLFDRTQFECKGSISGVFALSRHIKIYDVTKHGDVVSFWCHLKDEQKCIAILSDMCYNFAVKSRRGFLPFVYAALLRPGIIFGILLSIVVIAVYPYFVLDIKIDNAEYEQAVLEVLQSEGIKKNSFAFNIDTNGIEKKILAFDGISFVKATKYGTCLNIQIEEELDPPEIFPVGADSVVSQKKAVFTRAIVYSGTCVRSYGDVVDVGDVLIEGSVTVKEEKVETSASGMVFGKVYYEAEVFYNYVDNVRIEDCKKTVKALALSKIKSDAEILSVDYEITEYDGGHNVKVLITTEERID